MTYDQVVLLAIPVVIGAGAIVAGYVSKWLYPVRRRLTADELAPRAEAALDRAQVVSDEAEELYTSAADFVRIQEVVTMRSPPARQEPFAQGFIQYQRPKLSMAMRADDKENVVSEKLPPEKV